MNFELTYIVITTLIVNVMDTYSSFKIQSINTCINLILLKYNKN